MTSAVVQNEDIEGKLQRRGQSADLYFVIDCGKEDNRVDVNHGCVGILSLSKILLLVSSRAE